jgi:NAD(P)-dependent dehydrogenase (short-subunit alcohol dehydrogenase family)
MRTDNSSAIVTGGASGIGKACAEALASRGVKCVIIDRDQKRGGEVADALGGVFVHADVTDEVEVQAAVEAASALAPLRFAVNAAGMGNAGKVVDREGQPLALATFEKVIRVNLIGVFNCLRLEAAAMAKTNPLDEHNARGSIVNIASVAAFDGQAGQSGYAASKGGIVGMTLPLARDLVAVGVRVNTVAPGLIDTPIYGSSARADEFKANLGRNVLYPRRLGTAGELASMVIEVLTNDYMNAETIRVDGGIRMPPK